MKFPKIQRALDTGLFLPGLCRLPPPPSSAEVARLAELIPLVPDHLDLLLEWGGSHLDEIRVKAVGEVCRSRGHVVFADDYNGFIYQYDTSGAVFREDTDGGEFERIAGNIREFIDEVLLGPKGAEIYGQDWFRELRRHKLI